MKVPNVRPADVQPEVSLSRLQNEGSQRETAYRLDLLKSIKATE